MGALIGLVAVLMPVVIVGMALTYRFMSRLYFPETRKLSCNERRMDAEAVHPRAEGANVHELMAKCAEYQKRIQNLEDILRERGN